MDERGHRTSRFVEHFEEDVEVEGGRVKRRGRVGDKVMRMGGTLVTFGKGVFCWG